MNSNPRGWRSAGLMKVVTISSMLGAISLSSVAQAVSNPIKPAMIDKAETARTKQELRCLVVGIRTGQLALRFTPNGQSRAGLNNGNIVDVYRQQGIWFYVRVVAGPNSRVTGLEGWVNSNYLSCSD